MFPGKWHTELFQKILGLPNLIVKILSNAFFQKNSQQRLAWKGQFLLKSLEKISDARHSFTVIKSLFAVVATCFLLRCRKNQIFPHLLTLGHFFVSEQCSFRVTNKWSIYLDTASVELSNYILFNLDGSVGQKSSFWVLNLLLLLLLLSLLLYIYFTSM